MVNEGHEAGKGPLSKWLGGSQSTFFGAQVAS